MLKMEPWRVYRPEIADSHQFEEEPFWIRIKVIRISNLVYDIKLRIRIQGANKLRIRPDPDFLATEKS